VSAHLLDALHAAMDRRGGFLTRAAAEQTDCYRLLHGVDEGAPGVAVDRYGSIVLIQTWRDELGPSDLTAVGDAVGAALGFDPLVVWNHRAKNKSQAEAYDRWHAVPDLPTEPVGREAGLRFCVSPRHRGLDPLLFLDLRAGRRHVRAVCEEQPGLRCLNLFAYTCGVGIAAAAAGAEEVWNVDFAASSLAVGERNAELNSLPEGRCRFVQADAFVMARQLAGLPVKGRRGKLPAFERVEPQAFDLVVLDPPTWAKSPFGVVDLVRDYASVFKPALLATRPGGQLLVTNHVARVDADSWLDSLRRCADKHGRPIADLQLIPPDDDFPSSDDQPPLKMAALRLAGEA
jgi:23S rRNA (cytosine1962-C5)-methyltransferase